MKFEYVGFRAIISQLGVTFKQGKDDKYIYLPYVYEILVALNHEYNLNKNYSYNIKIEDANIDKLYQKVLHFFPNLDKEIEVKLENYKKHLEDEKEDVKKRPNLNEIEKNIYLSNLNIMENYRINRAKNKIFYYYGVATIAEVIKENRIKEITLPFNEKFWHTLKTLQGVLSSEKISSNIKAEYIDTNLRLKFTTSLV